MERDSAIISFVNDHGSRKLGAAGQS